jgi:hypothetical protein
MNSLNPSLINNLTEEITPLRKHDLAIALDFDGVCKLFTAHKHQIMSTCLFLHLYEFQRVPFPEYKQAYEYINFRSPDYAGKERFLCADALSRYLTDKGYPCSLPDLHRAVDDLIKQGKKIAAPNLLPYQRSDVVARALAWSDEVNAKVAKLTEIGLTPGIREHIFGPYRRVCDFYVVSTAAGQALPPLMEKEKITFILRYLGQETATKAESLVALSRAGYTAVFMFGDSIEDTRASTAAREHQPPEVQLLFVPVIPAQEERCFSEGHDIIKAVIQGKVPAARKQADRLAREFEGNEVGT